MVRIDQVLYPALMRYQQTLTQLETTAPNCPPEEILRVLLARDAVRTSLEAIEHPPPSLLSQLAALDRRLQQQQANIVRPEDYSLWRNSFQPPTAAWWWHFSTPPRRWWERLNWLWNGLTLAFLAISLSLIVDAVPRFLSGGLDAFSAGAVIIPSLLALLTSGALTPIGREARNYLFQNLAQPNWPLLSLILALGLALSLLAIHHSFFDDLAVHFYRRGELSNINWPSNKIIH